MTIKIKAPRAWAQPDMTNAGIGQKLHGDIPVRIVREADWRKLMKLVRTVENAADDREVDLCPCSTCSIKMREALDALRGKK